MRHVGTVKGRTRGKAGDIADCGLRIACLRRQADWGASRSHRDPPWQASRLALPPIADCGLEPGRETAQKAQNAKSLMRCNVCESCIYAKIFQRRGAEGTARPAATKRTEPRIKQSEAGIPIPNREAVWPVEASARRPYPPTSVQGQSKLIVPNRVIFQSDVPQIENFGTGANGGNREKTQRRNSVLSVFRQDYRTDGREGLKRKGAKARRRKEKSRNWESRNALPLCVFAPWRLCVEKSFLAVKSLALLVGGKSCEIGQP